MSISQVKEMIFFCIWQAATEPRYQDPCDEVHNPIQKACIRADVSSTLCSNHALSQVIVMDAKGTLAGSRTSTRQDMKLSSLS